MFAVQHKGGDLPAHDEDAHRYAGDRRTYGVHIAQVFRRKKKRIGPKRIHETAVDGAADDEPEYQ